VSRRNFIPAGGGFAALAIAVAVVPLLSGCGVSAKGDFDRGKQLFAAQCSTCHSLRDAGSTSTIGPDLDAAFAQARAQGMDPETIAGVVKDQVQNPRPVEETVGGGENPSVSMPADLVTGADLDDVASYLGTVAGNPEFKGPELPDDPGALVFLQNGCGSCHTMESAGTSGTTGPNLDDVIGKVFLNGKDNLKTPAGVEQAIVDPDKTIAPDYPPNVMPKDFGQRISPTDMDALVQFLLKCSGKGAQTAPCQPKSGG
jgi:mono/diheme cytochrome c family protein